MSRHGGPKTFGFWKSIFVGFAGVLLIVIGLALFEISIIATVILVLLGSFVILVASEAGRGRMRGLFRDPHSETMLKPKDGRYKDVPQNLWDQVLEKNTDNNIDK